MEVIVIKNPASLKLRFDYGLNSAGKVVIKTKSLSNVKPDAVRADLYAVATSLANLQEHPLQEVIVADNTTLSE